MKEQDWSEYVKTLPFDIRIGLANYVAQSFLDGVEKGKKEAIEEVRKAIDGQRPGYIEHGIATKEERAQLNGYHEACDDIDTELKALLDK